MLRMLLIRHSMTAGNLKKRYIGTTDEPLCPEGVELIRQVFYPQVEAVFVSPMRRCVETAGIIYPNRRLHIIDELAECDFGEFENKNYQELSGNANYQKWVDSGGQLPFPGGESREGFRWRCLNGFQKVVHNCMHHNITSAALVVHGGTIMNIMETYARPERSFYQWQVKNGCGYAVELDTELWKKNREELRVISRIPGALIERRER
ncbi:MAG TPA: histidine phosphatase family protein [Candidatus Blautia gallistercoris]|uniref:Histidine phosphatase family protein n=1 Tax=Candidatus Blautia gallistercoris TaxID=2838490 RepID=A0A9D1WJ03_9FIRM|nr:histidine phosphatase family protein [Candidatus Blautia gallistercoris]